VRIKRKDDGIAEGDLTPMIDMTFQLIAFFMVLVNFSEAEQDKRINLPASELAIPPEVAFEEPRTVQLTDDGMVIFGGREVPLAGLKPLLIRERQVLERAGKAASIVTVIVRADADAQTGKVQEMVETCQEAGFEKFALRAEQKSVSDTRL